MNYEDIKTNVKMAVLESSEKMIEIGETILNMPELGYCEEKTSQYVRSIFDEFEIKYTYPHAVTGIKARLYGKEHKLNVCIIGEMDAVKCAGHRFEGEPGNDAYLNDASLAMETFGYPSVSAKTLIRWQAEYIMDGGRTLDKPTHFEERKGSY